MLRPVKTHHFSDTFACFLKDSDDYLELMKTLPTIRSNKVFDLRTLDRTEFVEELQTLHEEYLAEEAAAAVEQARVEQLAFEEAETTTMEKEDTVAKSKATQAELDEASAKVTKVLAHLDLDPSVPVDVEHFVTSHEEATVQSDRSEDDRELVVEASKQMEASAAQPIAEDVTSFPIVEASAEAHSGTHQLVPTGSSSPRGINPLRFAEPQGVSEDRVHEIVQQALRQQQLETEAVFQAFQQRQQAEAEQHRLVLQNTITEQFIGLSQTLVNQIQHTAATLLGHVAHPVPQVQPPPPQPAPPDQAPPEQPPPPHEPPPQP